jgi:hypothetical protein
MEWQPIETAPKDERRFLACNQDGVVIIGRLVNSKHFAADSWAGIKNTVPTHWMPLPEPPRG